MGIFNKKSIKQEILELKKQIEVLSTEKSSSAYLADFNPYYFTEGYPTETNYEILLQLYKKESWVRAAIDVIKRTCLAKGYSIMPSEKLTKEEFDSENLQSALTSIRKLFKYPNPDETTQDILGDVTVDLNIFGDAYIELVRDDEKIKEMYNMNAQEMRIICDEHGKILFYIQKIDSIPLKDVPVEQLKGRYPYWEPRDIVHFKLPNPGNTVYGLSPLESLALAIECDIWAQLYNINFFKNDATPRGHLDLGNCSKAQLERNRAYWRSEMQGVKNAHKTIITEGGASYKAIGTAPKDMEFLNQRKFNRDEILAVFGVPPGKVCVFETANRSNSIEQSRTFKSETIVPLQNMIESRINRVLLSQLIEDEKIIFKFNPIDIYEESEQAKIDETYINSNVKVVNEVRHRLGLEPVDWGNKPLIKMTQIPLEVEPLAPTSILVQPEEEPTEEAI